MARMDRFVWFAIICALLMVVAGCSFSPDQKSAGSQVTTTTDTGVSGYVAGAHYLETSKRKPTFLNLGKPYPNQDFTVVIWGSDRWRFKKSPEQFYLHKTITVTGQRSYYQDKPQIVVYDPSQIVVK